MRVLIVHNAYQQPGGEDVVVANEHALLCRHGCDAQLWTISNDEIDGPWATIAAALRTPYSRPSRDRLAAVIASFAPSVVHIHNFFPLLSPSVYDACRAAGVAVVQTLHNYRTICAGALLLREGRACEDCIGGSPYQGALHGCYRGSRLGSLAVARMIDRHRRRGTWRHKVDRFIALTAFSKSKFVAAGFPANRIAIKPHFAPDRRLGEIEARAGALFVGRLSVEKGVSTILRAWTGLDPPLRVVGDGPLRDAVGKAQIPNIVVLGWQDADAVAEEMARAAFLVFPSVRTESFGLVIVEAFCQGLPVIASRIPGLEEIIEDGVNGLFCAAGDAADLASKVGWAHAHPEAMRQMGVNARRTFENKYSPVSNLSQLMRIYDAAIDERRTARPS